MVYRAGQPVSRDYVLFNNSKLWTSKEVYCYIISGTVSLQQMSYKPTSVDAKTLTTDSGGRLKLTMDTPSGKDMAYTVYFVSATGVHDKPGGQGGSDHDSLDGQSYSDCTDGFMSQKSSVGGSIKVTVPKLNVGTPTDVRAEAGSDDPGTIGVTWLFGEFTDIYSVIQNELAWASWTSPSSFLSKKGGTYSGTVTIPAFMPKDQKYTVVVFEESSGSFPEYGAASLKPGQGTNDQGFPWNYVIVALVVVLAVVALVMLLANRKRPSSELTPTSMTPPPAGSTMAPGAPGAAQPAPPAAPAAEPPAGASPPPAPQVTATAPSRPLPPPAPSVTGPVTMSNNAMCSYCNQWIMQGQPGVLCGCGKAYHPTCARLLGQCPACGTKTA